VKMSVGVELLKKMGWKEGQGVGARERRTKKKVKNGSLAATPGFILFRLHRRSLAWVVKFCGTPACNRQDVSEIKRMMKAILGVTGIPSTNENLNQY